jgi:hypothetical protein
MNLAAYSWALLDLRTREQDSSAKSPSAESRRSLGASASFLDNRGDNRGEPGSLAVILAILSKRDLRFEPRDIHEPWRFRAAA